MVDGHQSNLVIFSSGTDKVRAKRDPSLCNESVNGHFWSNLCLNCIFKWTKVDLICQNRHLVSYRQVPGSIPGRSSIDHFPHFFLFFWLCSSSVPLEFPKLTTLDPLVFFDENCFRLHVTKHPIVNIRFQGENGFWISLTFQSSNSIFKNKD